MTLSAELLETSDSMRAGFAIEPLESRALLSAAVEFSAGAVVSADGGIAGAFATRTVHEFNDSGVAPGAATGGASVRESMFGAESMPSRGAVNHVAPNGAMLIDPIKLQRIFEQAINQVFSDMASLGFGHHGFGRQVLPSVIIVVRGPIVDAPVSAPDIVTDSAAGSVTQQIGADATTAAALLSAHSVEADSGRDQSAASVRSDVLGTESVVASTDSRRAAAGVVSAAGRAGSNSIVREASEPLDQVTRVAQALAIDAAVFTDSLVDSAAVSAAAALSSVTEATAITDVVTVAVAPAASFFIPRLGSSFSMMCDSIATMTDEFASIPLFGGETQGDPRRAWFVTATVIAADVLLLTYLFRRRTARKSESPFAA